MDNQLERKKPSVLMDAGGVDLSRLRGLVPEDVLIRLPSIESITNRLRLGHFIAQAGHESGGFKIVTENLNYSAVGLLNIFPKYFNSIQANDSARQPERIANRVYSGRLGNGGPETGDGWKFRGRGFIQLTGRANYTAFAAWAGDPGILDEPDRVATEFPLSSAGFFFDRAGIWTVADLGESDDVVAQVTKKVNGGTIGLPNRINRFKMIMAVI